MELEQDEWQEELSQRPKLTPDERRANRRKGTLRCEWCNRFTAVPYDVWDANYDFPYIYYCERERCIQGRSEVIEYKNLLLVRPRKKKKRR